MIRILLFLLAIPVILFLFECYSKYTEITSYKLEHINSTENMDCFMHADFDGDGFNEIIGLNMNHTEYAAFESEYKSQPWKFHHMEKYFFTGLRTVDIDNDGKTEIIELLKDLYGDSSWVVAKNWNNEVVYKTEPIYGQNINDYSKEYPSWDGGIADFKVHDLDNDGVNEAIVTVHTGKDKLPRGIYAYTIPDGKLLWQYQIRGHIMDVQFADVDYDSLADLFIVPRAPSNGVYINNMADTVGYLIRLSHDGQMRWFRRVAPFFCGAHLLFTDLNNDGVNELYTEEILGKADSDKNVLIVQNIDFETGESIDRFPIKGLTDVKQFSGEFSRDGSKGIVTEKGIYILDKDLELVCHREKAGHRVFSVIDLNCDGIDEILTHKKDSLFILDTLLNDSFAFKSEKNIKISKVDLYPQLAYKVPCENTVYYLYFIDPRGSAGNKLIVKYALTYTPLSFVHKAGIVATDFGWYNLGLMFSFGFILGILVWRTIAGKLPENKTRDIPREYTNLLFALTAFNHGQTASANLNRLAFLSKNIPDDKNVLRNFMTSLNDSVTTFSQFTLKNLNDISRQAGKIKDYENNSLIRLVTQLESEVNKLIDIKIPQLVSRSKQIKKIIPDIVENIKVEIKNLRDSIRQKFSLDLIDEIKYLLTSLKPRFEELGMSLPDVTIDGDITAKAFFSPAEFSTILEELLSNSLESVRKCSNRSISIRIKFDNDIAIDIEDSGSGINESEFEKIFDRGYTHKENSGGYGLYYVKNTISKYDGSIRVIESTPHNKTVFRIVLRKSS